MNIFLDKPWSQYIPAMKEYLIPDRRYSEDSVDADVCEDDVGDISGTSSSSSPCDVPDTMKSLCSQRSNGVTGGGVSENRIYEGVNINENLSSESEDCASRSSSKDINSCRNRSSSGIGSCVNGNRSHITSDNSSCRTNTNSWDNISNSNSIDNLEASQCSPSTNSNLRPATSSPRSSSSSLRHLSTGPWSSSSNTCDQPESVVDLVTIKREAIELGRYIVLYMSGKVLDNVRTSDKHAMTLRRMVDHLSTKCDKAFAGMVRKLHIGELGRRADSLNCIARDMFNDGRCNWGRIVTLYAFAGWSARYCVEHGMSEGLIEEIGETVGKFVAEELSDWIAAQGGWDDMDRMFAEEESVESKLWKGLICTVLGLGAALATTVAVVR